MIKKRYDKAGPAVAEAMKRRGFDAYYVSTADEARAKALELISEGSTYKKVIESKVKFYGVEL